ncbi:MAG TPA: amidohydrolase family protein [Ktedonobacteraceae bacterium]|jgi:2,3-dihydroxybenzoate decarboxylase|nr:amidohydrolase family protein [Ktedonobacteraceae bacterium]
MQKITLEEHILPPGFEVPAGLKAMTTPEYVAQWTTHLKDIEHVRLPGMDRNEIALQVLSLFLGLEWETDTAAAIRYARQANDSIAEIVRQYPTRFAGFAMLPLQDPHEAALELERAVKQLGFKGALVNGHVNGEMIDEQKFWVVWERAEALGVPIYLHPGRVLVGQVNKIYQGYPELIGATWNWGCETGTYALRLIFSGLFDRFPRLTVILGHMGEMLPFVLWRLDSRAKISAGSRNLSLLPSEYIKRNIMITTSGQFAPEPLICAISTLGADRILFSVDYPFESTEEATQFIETAPISEADKKKICFSNAQRLLGL